MSQNLAHERMIKDYFLGELPEHEQECVQERLFIDPEFFEEFQIVEDELADNYVFGLLPDNEREKFERHFLSGPQQFRKLELTRSLDRYVSESRRIGMPESQILRGHSRDRLLAEAQTNRRVLASLIDSDWLGLQLLGHVGSSSSLTDLQELEPDRDIIPTLTRLVECGLLEEQHGKFSCTTLGKEILRKTESLSGVISSR